MVQAAAEVAPPAPVPRRPVAVVVLSGGVVLTTVVVLTNLFAGDARSVAVVGIVLAAMWAALTVVSSGPLLRGSVTERDVKLLKAWRSAGIVVAALSLVGTVVVVAAGASSGSVRFGPALWFLVFVDAVRIGVTVYGIVVAQQALSAARRALPA